MKKKVIGLTGVKMSGKTTSFNYLKALYPDIVEVTFAGKLKDSSAEVFAVDREAFDDQKVKEKELDVPRVVTEKHLRKLYALYEINADFETHIRPHLNKILHTPREIAQYVGTEVLRAVDEMIHCKAAAKNMKEGKLHVVTDIRFWNEYNFLKDNQEIEFLPVYVSNYIAETKASGDQHASEKYVLEIAKHCERLDNNSSLEDLKTRIIALVSNFALEKKHSCL